MIYTKVCPKCGIEFNTTREHQKFCSKACSNRGRPNERGDFDHSLEWERDSDDRWQCPYSRGVSCEVRNCSKCGWNPEVANARLEAYHKKWRESHER